MSEPATKVHVVCTACNAVNRIPGPRLADGPVCGKCREPLFTGKPAELTEAAFERQIARSDVPVLVDFWAPWCGPCLSMAPAYAEAAARLEPGVRVVKVDTERAQATSARLNVRSIPTLALFRNGREQARHAGAMGADGIMRWVTQQL